jgi:hypothetical protein
MRRWGIAFATSMVICLLYLAYLDRDGCWFYWRGVKGLIALVFPFLWLTLLFGLRLRWRIVLLAATLMGVLLLPHVDGPRFAAQESSAVATLRQWHATLESFKVSQPKKSYPQALPERPSFYDFAEAYRFDYTPSVSADGTIQGYVIAATPRRRSCGCARSFTITNEGRLYYTLEERAATTLDPLLQ